MEYCRNSWGRIELKFISLLLFLSAVNSVKASCEYTQFLELGETYNVYSPDYPKHYKDEKYCTWEITSPYIIKIYCRINMPVSEHCVEDNIVVQFAGNNTYKYCGLGTLQTEGKDPTIIFESLYFTQGGEFVCQTQAVEPFDESNCECGWKNELKIDPRIVNGTETDINEYPMMAAIVNSYTKQVRCGATIISDQYVVTAAHCITENISRINVVVGEHDVTTVNETTETKLYLIENCDIHPLYTRDKNDVAVCKIIGTINYTTEVGPVCLPFRHKRDSFAGSIVTALGWGTLDFGGRKSTTLQEVDLNVVSYEECVTYYPEKDISRKEICTFSVGKDSCQHDSGGPVLWRNPTTQNFVLVGITSYGFQCASYKPAVNMRVGAYLDWIISVTPDVRYCKVE